MDYLKKFLAITLIFVMQFQSVHASVAVGGGWGLNLTRVENSTSIFTAFKDGFQSTVAISPSSAQVAKSLLRGGLIGLALSAVTQALLDGIDFVMDSAKQEVRYVKIETQACNADLSNCTYAPYLYYLDYSSYRHKLYPTLESACIGFSKDQNINNPPYVYYYISTTAKPKPYSYYMLCNLNVTFMKVSGVFSSYYANKTANSKYSSSAKDPRKNVSIPLTTLATQIINLAEQGNPDAKAYIASVVQDMLEHDEDYRKSLEAQLDAKLKEAQTNTPKNECDPPAGVKFNKVTHYNKHGRDPDPNAGSHGCMAKTGSPIHWHYDVNYQAPNGQCFLKEHKFGGCGVAPL